MFVASNHETRIMIIMVYWDFVSVRREIHENKLGLSNAKLSKA